MNLHIPLTELLKYNIFELRELLQKYIMYKISFISGIWAVFYWISISL